MAGVLIRMKLALMRNQMTGWRGTRLAVGGLFGLLAAAATIWLGTAWLDAPQVLALGLGVWTLGWFAGPFLGGGTEETLRLEYFRMAPVPPWRLARALLAGAAVSVPSVATLIAFCALFAVGLRHGGAAPVVALAAVVLQLVLVLLLARIVVDALGTALRSRLAMDILVLSGSVLVAAAIVGLLAVAEPAWNLVRTLMGGELADVPAWLLAVPSGWGVTAVEAAADGRWAVSAAALAGLAALDAVLLTLWVRLLRIRLVAVAPARRGRRSPDREAAGRPLAATPTGAATVRALRTWLRDYEIRIVVVATVAVGVGYGLVGGFMWPYFLPLAGVLALSVACSESANLFGFDGSALWLTLVGPGTERAEVRGRQLAWLAVFTPIGLVISVAALVLTGPDAQDAVPFAIALFPAMLGIGSGLVVLFSVLAPYPVGVDSSVPGTGKSLAPPIRRLVLPAQAVGLAPTAGVVGLGMLLDSSLIQWLALAVGVGTGWLGAWLLGRYAYERLQEKGPELLQSLKPV